MISISVSAATAAGNGIAAHVVSNGPLNHLLHPDTAPGPYGISADIDLAGLTGSVPGPLASLADALSSIAPAFLHVGFNDTPLQPGITLQGTEINWPHLGIGQGIPGLSDSTIVNLHNILKG
ncbi:MAG TPA: hypothetical protein VFB36_01690 [Nevskiaceae bacterium]|nr:hypothetical protein [Nevskiaceae bacterium]